MSEKQHSNFLSQPEAVLLLLSEMSLRSFGYVGILILHIQMRLANVFCLSMSRKDILKETEESVIESLLHLVYQQTPPAVAE